MTNETPCQIAEEIAKQLVDKWQYFWMNQRQNSEQDFKNYFRRALGVDANMKAHLYHLLAQAIREASTVEIPFKYQTPKCDWDDGYNVAISEIKNLNPSKTWKEVE